jgi:hypothetical protein
MQMVGWLPGRQQQEGMARTGKQHVRTKDEAPQPDGGGGGGGGDSGGCGCGCGDVTEERSGESTAATASPSACSSSPFEERERGLAAVLEALIAIDARREATLQLAVDARVAAMAPQIAEWAAHGFGVAARRKHELCCELLEEASTCSSVEQLRLCRHYEAFMEEVSDHRWPKKASKDLTLARGFIEGLRTRYSLDVSRRKAETRARAAARANVACSAVSRDAAEEAEAAATDVARQHATFLAHSDHRPIWVSLFSAEGGRRLCTVCSHNIQEFVTDGVTSYVCAQPCVRGSRGAGYSRLLARAMLSPVAKARHTQDVLQLVEQQLCRRRRCGGASTPTSSSSGPAALPGEHDIDVDAVCLQEVDREVLAALRQASGAGGGWYVHACATAEEAAPPEGRCSAITAIVTREPPLRLLPDVVVETEHGKRVRRHAALVLASGVALLSVHVRHPPRPAPPPHVGGAKANAQPSNEQHIEQTEGAIIRALSELRAAAGTGGIVRHHRVSAALAVGDYNGPLGSASTAGGSGSAGTKAGWQVVGRGSPSSSPTQYGKPEAVDGAIALSAEGRQLLVLRVCDHPPATT